MATLSRAARPVTFPTAKLVAADGSLTLDPIKFCLRTGYAYALDKSSGRRLWEAEITGSERKGDTITVHLADGPDVTARKYCAPCAQRH